MIFPPPDKILAALTEMSQVKVELLRRCIAYAENNNTTEAHRFVLSPQRLLITDKGIKVEQSADLILVEEVHGAVPRVIAKAAVCASSRAV